MSKFRRFGGAAPLLAVAAATAVPAYAETAAGSTIQNTVTVTYDVGGVAQPQLTATDTFTVDRKINLTVVEEGSSTTQVSPGELAAVTSFLVSNLSNAPLDLSLAASNAGGDDFDVTNLTIFADTNNDGDYDPGVDQQITYLDQIAAETSNIRVFILSDIPLGETTGEVSAVRLTATAAEATAAGSLGAIVTETGTANTNGVDTVFADSNAGGNTARDGIHFGEDDYTISTAALSALKTSRIVSDPFNGSTNPKMIPGATVEYCIAVTNGGGAAATAVAISDTLPSTTAYEPSFGVKVDGTVTGSTCNSDGAIAGAHAAGVVSGTIPSITAGQTRTVLFRVTIN